MFVGLVAPIHGIKFWIVRLQVIEGFKECRFGGIGN